VQLSRPPVMAADLAAPLWVRQSALARQMARLPCRTRGRTWRLPTPPRRNAGKWVG